MSSGGKPVEMDAATAIRGRWSSVIRETFLREAWLVELLPYGTTDLGLLTPSFRELAARTREELLEQACGQDTRQERSPPAITAEIGRRLRELVKHAKVAQPRANESGRLAL